MTEPDKVTLADIERLNELARKAMSEASATQTQEPEPIPAEVMEAAEFLHVKSMFCDEDHWDNYFCSGAEDHIEQAQALIQAGVIFPKKEGT